MRKDIKIGMLIGLGLVIIGLIVISSWPGGTVEERLKESANKPDRLIVKPPAYRVVKPPDEAVEHFIEPAEDSTAQGAKEVVEQIDVPDEPDERISRVAEHVVKEFKEPVIEAGPRIHIVADNESLSSIAKLHYGDANKWTLIAEANKNIITNVDRLSLGMRLVIPKPK